jgi:hypothetical protein
MIDRGPLPSETHLALQLCNHGIPIVSEAHILQVHNLASIQPGSEGKKIINILPYLGGKSMEMHFS